MDYPKAYALLVETMSKAIDEINKSRTITQEMENAIRMLKGGLEKAEEMYISAEE